MSNKLEFPLTLGLQKTGLPLIVTSGKLKNLCFLIDTGSTHNTLFDFVYEHFKNEFKILNGTQNIMGIEGEYKETPLIEATFNFEASEAVTQVQEETGVQIHGILSTDFLIKNKWIINFDKLIISTYDSE